MANTGGREGSYNLFLKIDGVTEIMKRVTIAAGESQDVSFSVTREDVGSYSIGAVTAIALVVIFRRRVSQALGIFFPRLSGE